MLDFSPPNPGHIGDPISDQLLASGCNAAVIQRCDDHVQHSLNHRYFFLEMNANLLKYDLEAKDK